VTTVIAAAVERAAELRRRISSTPVIDVRDAAEKQRLLAEADEATEALRTVADVVVGAALSTTDAGADALDNRLAAVAPKVASALDPNRRPDDRAVALFELQVQASEWLQAGKPALEPDRRPFHWPLELPEVFLSGRKMNAVVGNPPFLGGSKITGSFGTDYREWLVSRLAKGRRGHADIVTYFFLQAAHLLGPQGGTGLLATNTISQGVAREVGLDHLTADGWIITRAVKSRPWPGDATLEIAQVWLHRDAWMGEVVLADKRVQAITSSLDPRGRVTGKPLRLDANSGIAFEGSKIGGTGFILNSAERNRLVDLNSRNEDILFPFLAGEDLNNSPIQAPGRWIINFRDWPLERAEDYPDCMAIVRERVKPFRDQNNRLQYRERWWQYVEIRPGLHGAIEDLTRVLAVTRHSKTVMPASVRTGIVFSDAICVLAYDDEAHFGLMSSAFHWWWAITHASTIRTDIRYTPTDCFGTFSQPELIEAVGKAGGALDAHRRTLMLERWEGLTKTYNRVHDPDEHAEDIAELRRLHVELDHAVAVAYGWDDLPMDHDFHDTQQGVRYTLGPTTRTELLDRLLELNHERAAAEAAAGLTGQRRSGTRRRRPAEGQTSLEAL
jgi:hypothetical protein